ncbi:MAG TPA: HD domain-containing protein [Anaerolineaceae bacterium]|nr:HD domain-containing protein [Anaerolineaceae bacterium]
MKLPTIEQTHAYLAEAAKLNPGRWVDHSYCAGEAARRIARRCPDLDCEAAYILGCLHDIGRRAGMYQMRHLIDGYEFLIQEGYPDAADICLTHSFVYKNLEAYLGERDLPAEQIDFLRHYLEYAGYTPYDRLIQLCDSLAMPGGFCTLEKRMVDVTQRYGFNQYTLQKWQALYALKAEIDHTAGMSIYHLLIDPPAPGMAGIVENMLA